MGNVTINGGNNAAGYGSTINLQRNGSTIGQIGQISSIIGSSNASDMAYASGTGLGHNFYVNGSTTAAATIDASGNLGLGVTPSAWGSNFKAMQIGAYPSLWFDGSTSFYSSNNAYNNGTNFIYRNNGYATSYNQAALTGVHSWHIAPSGTAGNTATFTTAMTLDASGNLMLGATTNSTLGVLEVASANKTIAGGTGQICAYTNNTATIDVGGQIVLGGSYTGTSPTTFGAMSARKENATAGSIAGYLSLSTSQGGVGMTERQRISSTGIVTMSAYGAGAATFSAAGVISSVSDETWKTKDGVPLNPDAMLKKLEPGYWYYNEEKAPIFGAERQLGFYAQNVNYAIGIEAAPIPEEGKPWGYYDRSVLAVTVMSLQKALATIESLTARLEVLEAK